MGFRLALLVGIVALSSGLALPPAAGSDAADDGVAFEPWPDAPSNLPTRSMEEAAYLLDKSVERSPEAYTGVYLDSDAARVVVTLPDGEDAESREAAISQEFAQSEFAQDVDVHFSRVKYSLANMKEVWAALEDVLLSEQYDGQLVGVGTDPSRGVAVVYATEDSDAMRAELKAIHGDKVVYRQTERPTLDAGGHREFDYQPNYGGASYRRWNVNHTAQAGRCSTAFPVALAGVRYMLTAGHCLPGATPYPRAWSGGFTSTTPPADIYYFGTRGTTTVGGQPGALTQGNADIYGDWSFITRNNMYAPQVYTGSPGTSNTHRVARARWANPPMGSIWCVSGRTTGQTCRLQVVDPNVTVDFGIDIAQLFLTQHRDGSGGFDDDGPEPGDSGGAVYRAADVAGKIEVTASHTGSGTSPASGIRWWAHSKINGVRTWNPNVNVVVAP